LREDYADRLGDGALTNAARAGIGVRSAMTSPPLTFEAAVHGARLCLPLLPGVLVFATAFGAAAVGKGMRRWR
jgi:hypothetical protein